MNNKTKKSYTILVVILLLFQKTYAQNYSIGFQGIINKSYFDIKLNGRQQSSFKQGFGIGVELQRKLTENIFIVFAPSYNRFICEYNTKSKIIGDDKDYYIEDEIRTLYFPLLIRLKTGGNFKFISDFGFGLNSLHSTPRTITSNIDLNSILANNLVKMYERDIPDLILGVGFENYFIKNNSISMTLKAQFALENYYEDNFNSNNDKINSEIYSINVTYRHYFNFNRNKK